MNWRAIIALPLTLGIAQSAAADQPATQDLLLCSALFEARKDWGEALGQPRAHTDMMEGYARILLSAAQERMPPSDWQMPMPLFGEPGDEPLEPERNNLVLPILTRMAEKNPLTTRLPLCVEDAICINCTLLVEQAVRTSN